MAYIVLGMSGGVDSSVAAYLLKQQGHQVLGVFMKNWEDDAYCGARQDFVDAASVAEKIGIDIDYVNFAKEYKDKVFSYFLKEYQNGRTPNPDILCNSEIKFNCFLHYAKKLGADYIATGHYARLLPHQDAFYVHKALDLSKDQSYFLYRLNQDQLSKSIFPLGDLQKTQVRAIAQDIGLHNHAKADSVGICFIGERPFRDFLSQYIQHQPGPVYNEANQMIGTHQGLAFYTLGQRKGLNIGGIKNMPEKPWFVAKKDMQSNALYLVQGHDHASLYARDVYFSDAHWASGHPPSLSAQLDAKARYRQGVQAGVLHVLESANTPAYYQFDLPQWAITPGQSLVFYDGTRCLGGGVIDGC